MSRTQLPDASESTVADTDVADVPTPESIHMTRAIAERLFDAHAKDLLRYVTRRVGRASAEDIVSDVFVVVLGQKMPADRDDNDQRAWLFGVATNMLRRHARDQARALRAAARQAGQRTVADHETDEEGLADRVDAQARAHGLVAALGELDPEDLDLLLLTAWAGLTPSEAASALAIAPGTARSRLHRIRRQLRSHLEAASPRSQS